MTLGHEYLEHIITDWTRNLWALNNKYRMTGKASGDTVAHELHEKMYPDNNRGLTRAQSISEQGFVLLAYGLAYMPDRAADAISGTKLVDAWRKAVHRNSYQQRYNLFEEELKQAIDKFGATAAIAEFPDCKAEGKDIVAALEHVGYKPSIMNRNVVNDLILKAAKGDAPKPAAAQPKP